MSLHNYKEDQRVIWTENSGITTLDPKPYYHPLGSLLVGGGMASYMEVQNRGVFGGT